MGRAGRPGRSRLRPPISIRVRVPSGGGAYLLILQDAMGRFDANFGDALFPMRPARVSPVVAKLVKSEKEPSKHSEGEQCDDDSVAHDSVSFLEATVAKAATSQMRVSEHVGQLLSLIRIQNVVNILQPRENARHDLGNRPLP